jgi:hypothetical protein
MLSITFPLSLGHTAAELGVGGGGIVGENVIWPQCGGVLLWAGHVLGDDRLARRYFAAFVLADIGRRD